MNSGLLLDFCPFHWACRIPAKQYRDPAEFPWLTRRRGGAHVPLAAKLVVEPVRVAVGPRRDTEASTELADEMRDTTVPDLFGDAGDRELAVDQQSRALSRRISFTN